MYKFGTALNNILLIRTTAKELSIESYISEKTIKDARWIQGSYKTNHTRPRKSTAMLLLKAMRIIVQRRITELEEGLAKLEAAYKEEYGSVKM